MGKRDNCKKTDQTHQAVSVASATCENSIATACSSNLSSLSSCLTYLGSVDTTDGTKNVITSTPSTGLTAQLALDTMDCVELDCNTIITTNTAKLNGYYQPGTTITTEPYYYPWTGIGETNIGSYSISVDLANIVSDMTEFRLKSNRKRINLKFNL